jgi:hypothetical protein
MMRLIKHIIEPTRLLLAWQSSNETHRFRYIVAELSQVGNETILTYLSKTKDFRMALEKGFEGYPAYPLTQEVYHQVLDTFMRRLPPRTRGDFAQYLEGLRLPSNVKLSDFALLGYAGAKLLSDGFSIIHPFDNVSTSFELLIEVVRFRHLPEEQKVINIEDQVSFLEEKIHPITHEPAIHIIVNGNKIGYVNRGLIPTFLDWMEKDRIENAWVEKFNGTQGRPMAYVYVKISASKN